MIKYRLKREEGQGLVEYALILVLVAVVVIAILLQLGPEVSRVFARITAVLQHSGVIISNGAITSLNATYAPGGYGTPARLIVRVTVSQSATVTVSGDGGISGSQSCSSTCTFTFNNPPGHGFVTAVDDIGGEGVTVSW